MSLRRCLALCLAALLSALPWRAAALAEGELRFNIVEMHQIDDEITLYLTRYADDWTVDGRTYSAGQYIVSMDSENPPLQSAENLRQAGGDIHYILLVDISGSISKKASGGNPAESDAINEALKRFYGNLQDSEYVTLIPFGNSGANIAVREQKREGVANQPALSFKDSYTHMFEAIVTGANIYADNPEKFARTAMIMITDGTDDYTNSNASMQNADHWTFEQAKQKMLAANVPFYALMFRRDKGNQSQVAELATSTNGDSTVTDTAHLSEKLTSLQSITRNSSVLKLKLEQAADKPKNQVINTKFQVAVDGGSGERTPERLFDVDWSKVIAQQVPVDQFLDSFHVSGITEDDTEIIVRTEPGATVSFSQNNRILDTLTADDQGVVTWTFSNRFRPDDEIRVYARDAAGNDKLEDEKSGVNQANPFIVKVEKSRRAPIVVTLPEEISKNDYTCYGKTLTMTVTGEPGAAVDITWAADEVDQTTFQRNLQNNGALTLRLDYDEVNGLLTDKVAGGNVVVRYSDGLGASCVGASEGSIIWYPEEIDGDITDPEPLTPLTEDSATWTLKAEENAMVRIQWDGERSDERKADASGRVTFDVPEKLKEEQEVILTAEDEADNQSKPVRLTVGKSMRDEIKVDAIPEKVVEDELTVRGGAMPDQALTITWVPANGAQQTSHTVQANGQGTFNDSFSRDECTLGEGSITVSYADGRSYSRLVRLDTIRWTPSIASPISAGETPPGDEPTPEPGPEPEPMTPVPTPAPNPFTVFLIRAFGEDYLHSPLMWVVVAVLVLIVVLVIVLIATAGRKKKKNGPPIQPVPASPAAPAPGVPTTRPGGMGEGTVEVGNAQPFNQHQGAAYIDDSGTQRLGVFPGEEIGSTGTVRLDAVIPTGTVRIERQKKLTLILEESRPGMVGITERRVNLADGKTVVVGRADGVDVQIQDETVSSHHLDISAEGEQLFVIDEKSSNGTVINGEELAHRQRRPLREGDRLEIGRTTLVAHIEH